jgi:hypothetical protein
MEASQMHDSSSGISALRFLHESKRSQGIEKYSAPVFAQVERSTSSGISALRLLHERERIQQKGGVLAGDSDREDESSCSSEGTKLEYVRKCEQLDEDFSRNISDLNGINYSSDSCLGFIPFHSQVSSECQSCESTKTLCSKKSNRALSEKSRKIDIDDLVYIIICIYYESHFCYSFTHIA